MRKVLVNPGKHDLAASFGLLALRLVPALSMVLDHGTDKVTQFGAGIVDPFGLGLTFASAVLVAVELVCPILVGVGLLTRPAALISAAGLALITFRYPWWDAGFLPEYAHLHALGRTPIYLYLTAFGGVVLTGAGALSFDRLIQGKG
jgi:uncharacterized membrane protein YphA (DoxX/SURF4 family)